MNICQDNSLWDAVVIGAGPAGSVAAIRLADAGLRVILVERKSFPRDKVCGGCLNARALAVLEEMGLERVALESSGVGVQQLSLRAGGRSLEVPTPAGMAICRSEFDDRLAREACAHGVKFVTGVTASIVPAKCHTNLPQKNQEYHEIRLDSLGRDTSTIQARIVVLAGGLHSASHVAPHLLVARISPASRIGAGTLMATAPNEFTEGTVYMSVADGGYAGAVCLSDGRLIVAAALDRDFVRRSGNVASAVQTIFAVNGWGAVTFTDPHAFHGTPQLTRTVIRPAAERLFVIGDAAGYVEPFTGEGMASALVTATAVTPFVIRGVEQWESTLAVEWTREHRQLIQHRQLWCRAFAALLRHPRLTRIAVSVTSRWPNLPRALARQIVGKTSFRRSSSVKGSHEPAASLLKTL